MEIDLSCAIFLKRILFEDLKNNVPRCLTSKYTNTNTQIHKYTNTVWAKIINNNIIIIIQLQKQIPELCSKQLLVFWFDIHNNMFPNIVKKVFLKKIEKCKCYKPSSSDHQQQHHHPLVEPMHKSPIFEGALSRTFTILSGLVENLLGSPQKILAPSAPPRNTKKRHVFQILDIF